ncbi:MAG: hypothetical protein IRY97_00830, partial [Thermomicrobiaceae bacterium]|nr:hypothetical protein [Thermomicrobiaceae bacterium]
MARETERERGASGAGLAAAERATARLEERARPRRRWRTLLRSRSAQLGGAIVLALIVVALVGPLLAPYSPTRPSYLHQFEGPSRAHLLGTDEFGRDTLSRLLYGARIALAIGLLADGIALVAGTAIGLTAGYYG